MNKAVIAPDSFKGTMSSMEVCEIMGGAFSKIMPETETVKIPAADGGEGTAEAFLYAVGGKKVCAKTKNPLFEDIQAYYAILRDKKTAVIETAAASGLTLIETKKSPLEASTYGTGLLIKDALDKGCDKIILGLGGSATNDGGAGIITALGAKLADENGSETAPSNRGLGQLRHIDGSELDKRLKNCGFVVACDVENVLCGPFGAARVFGPQKGADEKTVEVLDANLSKYADALHKQTGRDIKNIPGTGAAGGILASLLCFPEFFKCEIRSGIDIILDAAGFDEAIKDADIVFSGEGRFDSQSLYGKAVSGIAKRAKKQNKPVIVIAGSAGKYGDEIYDLGISAVFTACSGLYSDFDELKGMCREDLYKTAENVLRALTCRTRFFRC
ncbi:MAG: glycerate kinase [Oscillospiraceae bacterium]|nr:glycerate kinase [Oscillospiraceae bacterium]